MNSTELNSDCRAVLEQFASGEISLAEMHAALSEISGSLLRENESMRWFSLFQVAPEQCVYITRSHLERMLDRRRSGRISDQELIDWATMITVNDAFYWDWQDEVLAEWINRLTLDFMPEDR